MEARISDAGKAFGALRKGLFGSHSITPQAKRHAYEALILSILLFGCEGWCLTEALLQRLRAFLGECVRAMCRVTRTHMWRHHTTSEELRAMEHSIGHGPCVCNCKVLEPYSGFR